MGAGQDLRGRRRHHQPRGAGWGDRAAACDLHAAAGAHRRLLEAGGDGDPRHRARRRARARDGRALPRRGRRMRCSASPRSTSASSRAPRARSGCRGWWASRRRSTCASRASRSRRPRRTRAGLDRRRHRRRSRRRARCAFARSRGGSRSGSGRRASAATARHAGSERAAASPRRASWRRRPAAGRSRRSRRSTRSPPRPRCRSTRAAGASASCSSSASQSEQAKALIHVFFAERAVTKVRGLSKDAVPRPIERVAIVGAGTMGGGIAMACANAGLAVTVQGLDPRPRSTPAWRRSAATTTRR